MAEINLSDDKFDLGKLVVCLKARWWSENPKLVVVDFEERPTRHPFSLRLDLDKITFIDHARSETIDKAVRSNAKSIWKTIIARKDHRPRKATRAR